MDNALSSYLRDAVRFRRGVLLVPASTAVWPVVRDKTAMCETGSTPVSGNNESDVEMGRAILQIVE